MLPNCMQSCVPSYGTKVVERQGKFKGKKESFTLFDFSTQF